MDAKAAGYGMPQRLLTPGPPDSTFRFGGRFRMRGFRCRRPCLRGAWHRMEISKGWAAYRNICVIERHRQVHRHDYMVKSLHCLHVDRLQQHISTSTHSPVCMSVETTTNTWTFEHKQPRLKEAHKHAGMHTHFKARIIIRRHPCALSYATKSQLKWKAPCLGPLLH